MDSVANRIDVYPPSLPLLNYVPVMHALIRRFITDQAVGTKLYRLTEQMAVFCVLQSRVETNRLTVTAEQQQR